MERLTIPNDDREGSCDVMVNRSRNGVYRYTKCKCKARFATHKEGVTDMKMCTKHLHRFKLTAKSKGVTEIL